jgi:hypothetical protein
MRVGRTQALLPEPNVVAALRWASHDEAVVSPTCTFDVQTTRDAPGIAQTALLSHRT